jgi:hypothetical protein
MTTKLENMTYDEKAEFYWENPEAIPDGYSVLKDCTHPDPAMIEYTIRQLKNQSEGLRNIVNHDKEHWEGFTATEKEDE